MVERRNRNTRLATPMATTSGTKRKSRERGVADLARPIDSQWTPGVGEAEFGEVPR